MPRRPTSDPLPPAPHPLLRAARWSPLPLLAAWFGVVRLLSTRRRGLAAAALIAAVALTLAAAWCYLRGAALTFRRLMRETRGECCPACGFDLRGAYGRDVRTCTECGAAFTERQRERLAAYPPPRP